VTRAEARPVLGNNVRRCKDCGRKVGWIAAVKGRVMFRPLSCCKTPLTESYYVCKTCARSQS